MSMRIELKAAWAERASEAEQCCGRSGMPGPKLSLTPKNPIVRALTHNPLKRRAEGSAATDSAIGRSRTSTQRNRWSASP